MANKRICHLSSFSRRNQDTMCTFLRVQIVLAMGLLNMGSSNVKENAISAINITA